MKLLFLVASAHAFGAFGEMAELAEDWDCSKYDEKDKEGYMKAGIPKPQTKIAIIFRCESSEGLEK